MSTEKRSFGFVLLQIGLAVVFVLTGLALVGTRLNFLRVFSTQESGEVLTALSKIFKSANLVVVLAVGIGVLLVISGVLLIVRLFTSTGDFARVIRFVTLIVWIVVTVMVHVLPLVTGGWNPLVFLGLARDLIVIGGLLLI